MPRLVRRRPLLERWKAYLNPYDFLLWLSEEIETRDWDDQSFANPLGAALNFIFLLARANSGPGQNSGDDVFGDSSGSGWFSWFSASVVHLLAMLSVVNAAYTFLRKRQYRLFENPVENAPGTPSAHRVQVDSSPKSADPIREVWELAVWDPVPVCLRLFCLFSPGHVLLYWLFLPIAPSDPRPSTTVVTTVVLAAILSAQLLFLQLYHTQQTKDMAIIHKEVLNEYDTKYVHPRLNPPVRDVGTQYTVSGDGFDTEGENEVVTYTPTTIIRRGFRTNPNPNYAKLLPQPTMLSPNPTFETPVNYPRRDSTPLRTSDVGIRQPQFRQSTSNKPVSVGIGDGGSLGIYSHSNSPLKKATSMYDIQGGRKDMPKNSFQSAQREIMEERERSMSPMKRLQETERESARRRTSVPPEFNTQHQGVANGSLHRKSRGLF